MLPLSNVGSIEPHLANYTSKKDVNSNEQNESAKSHPDTSKNTGKDDHQLTLYS